MSFSTPRNKVFWLGILKISIVVSVALLSYRTLPFHQLNYQVNFSYPPNAPITPLSSLLSWDARFYYFIAERGYQPIDVRGVKHDLASAYYPLYPMLVSLAALIVATPLAGLLLSNLLFLFGLMLFHRLIEAEHGLKIANSAIFALLLFPSSFFFSLVYTESLFFVLVLLTFLALREKRIVLVAISSLMLSLTRPVGVLILIPLLAYGCINWRSTTLRAKLLLILAPLSGFLLTQLVIASYTGDLLSSFKAQAPFTSQYSLLNLLHPVDWFQKNFIEINWQLHGIGTSALDRIFFVLYLPFLVLIWRHQPRIYFWYALAFGLVPALTGVINSYIRYLLVVFPLFPEIARLLLKQPRLLIIVAGAISAALQLWLIVRYSLNYWAG